MKKELIYLRPLKVKDALVSHKWRNNPKIWEYTGSKPDRVISQEMETEWIKEVLKRRDEMRFAICISKNHKYIGNVQLTKIETKKAEFHIFIGEIDYWGKGIGKDATKKMIDIGCNELKLETIYLEVDKRNIAAIQSYCSVGFKVQKTEGNILFMNINLNG